MGTHESHSPRERLLEAADELFYPEGLRAVGIDRLLEHAGVAKASLYSNFGSKEGLIASYLTMRHERWLASLSDTLATRFATPADRLIGIFDVLDTFFHTPSFNGCSFINAGVEKVPGEAIELAIADFRKWVYGLFRDLARDAGIAGADALARKLVLIYDGSHIVAQLDHDRTAAQAAKEIAQTLIQQAMNA